MGLLNSHQRKMTNATLKTLWTKLHFSIFYKYTVSLMTLAIQCEVHVDRYITHTHFHWLTTDVVPVFCLNELIKKVGVLHAQSDARAVGVPSPQVI